MLFTSAPFFRVESDLRDLQVELLRVKNAFSWRATKPLRLLGFFLRYLVKTISESIGRKNV